MKPIILLLSIWTLLLFSACSDDKDNLNENLPQPSFITDQETYTIGETVHFTDKSTPGAGDIIEWYWHFGFDGQGNYSTEQHPEIVYERTGEFEVKLTVTDKLGGYATTIDTVLVRPDNMPPVADFTVSPSICKINEEITLTDISTADEYLTIVSRLWDLGNGETSTDEVVKVTYTSTGFVTVSLTVTDSKGITDKKETTLNIRGDVQPGGFDVLWSQTFETGSTLRSISPAVGDNGNVYVSSNAMMLRAYSPEGTELWAFDLAAEGGSGGNQGSSPIVDSNGDIYIGVYPASGNPGLVFAVYPDGRKKWRYDYVSGVRVDYGTPAISTDGDILIGTRGTDGGLHKINVLTGQRRWWSKSPNGGGNGRIVVDKNGVAYSALTSAHGISRTDINGTNILPSLGKDKSYFASGVAPAIDSDGTIYAGFEQGVVAAYDPATGLSKWENTTLGKIDYSGIAIATDGSLYVGTSDATPRLVALNKSNGNIKWSYDNEAIIQSAPAIDNLGNIHFGDNAGNYIVLDANGNELHKVKLGDQIWSSPVISDYGTIYVSVLDGGNCKLFAIECGIAGPADTPWPQSGQNARRAGQQK